MNKIPSSKLGAVQILNQIRTGGSMEIDRKMLPLGTELIRPGAGDLLILRRSGVLFTNVLTYPEV